MNNINAVLPPAMAMYLIGLLYRNTRTSCVSLGLLCAHVSHDTLRRVPYQKGLCRKFQQEASEIITIDDLRSQDKTALSAFGGCPQRAPAAPCASPA